MIELNKIYNEDCIETMKRMPNESVNLIITSPPYNLGNAKKGSFYGGKSKGDKIEYLNHDDNMDKNDYISWQHKLFNEWMRIIKNDGAIFYNHKPRILDGVFDDRKNLVPFPIRQEIIWCRGGMVNFSGSFFANNTERIFIICKDKWHPNKEFLGLGEVWNVSPEINTVHPAPFPLELAEKVVKSSSNEGDVVLDPMCGSGTTCVASKKFNRHYIGIDNCSDYVDMANDRLNKYEGQQRLVVK